MRERKQKYTIKDAIINHIRENKKEYLSVSVIFLIGIVLGVMFINNVKENQQIEIQNYIHNFIDSLKNDNIVDKGALLKVSLQKNILLGIVLWFVGSTVIGIPIVYALVGYRGFCLAYTIASAVAVLGTGKGILFSLSSIFLQNIIFIPILLALAVSGIKLYKSIVKDKRRENIKGEIIRHTIFSIIGTVILIISSFVEVYASTNILMLLVKYI